MTYTDWDINITGPAGPTGPQGLIPEAPADGHLYGRNGQAAAWQQVAPLGTYLPLAGGTLTGALTMSSAAVSLDFPAGQNKPIFFYTSGSPRWIVYVNGVAESGSNVGSDFGVGRYTDGGAYVDTPLQISRATGTVTLTGAQLNVSPSGPYTLTHTIAPGDSAIGMNKAAGIVSGSSPPSGHFNQIYGSTAGQARWIMGLGDSTVETGSNTGSNFVIYNCNDAGQTAGLPLQINRATGVVTVQNLVVAPGSNVGPTAYSSGFGLGGGLMMGGTSPALYLAKMDINGNYAGTWYCAFDYNSGGVFSIASGTANKPGGGSWSAGSDSRIKTVLEGYTHGLAEIEQLKPVTYVYKGNDTRDSPKGTSIHAISQHRDAALSQRRFIGLTAQDCEDVLPELVGRTIGYIDGRQVNDLRTLDPSALVYVLINAVKELSARVRALEGKPPTLHLPWTKQKAA